MKKATRFLAFLLALAAACVPCHAAAEGLKPSYNVGSAYRKSPYYRRLTETELTGDNRFDLISVALSQLGYHEGDSDLDMDGMNSRGGRNFVEFNRIYGRVDNREGNGTSYGYEWCAAFVSWCLRQAGVPCSAAVTEISCGRMTKWYQNKDAFFDPQSHTPLSGDIIMFSSDGDPGHVGVVFGVKDGCVYTIEGNNSGRVAIHCYALDDDYILGYCVPEYESAKGADCAGLFSENCDRTGAYVVVCDSLNVREKPDGGSPIAGRLKRGERVEVTDFSYDWGRISADGTEGWIAISGAMPEKDRVCTVEYDANRGSGGLDFQRTLAGGTIFISSHTPGRKGHSFAGWAKEKNAKKADYNPGDKYIADSDMTLYALWEPCTYTVTFYGCDGSVISRRQYRYQDRIAEPPPPEKPDDAEYSYVFAGWDKEPADVAVRSMDYHPTYNAVPLSRQSSGEDLPGAGKRFRLPAALAIAVAVVSAAAGIIYAAVKKSKRGKK